MQKAEGRRQKAEGSRQKAAGRKQRRVSLATRCFVFCLLLSAFCLLPSTARAQKVVDKMVATVNAGVLPKCGEVCLITYSDLLWQEFPANSLHCLKRWEC